MTRFLRPTGPDAWDVHLDDEVIGTVRREADRYRALTRNGRIPMRNGSVLSADDNGIPHSWETRREPIHETPQEAAKLIVLAIQTSQAINAQIDMERANGWSTD